MKKKKCANKHKTLAEIGKCPKCSKMVKDKWGIKISVK